MTVPKGNMRGVQDIRTHSGTVDRVFVRSKAHLKIACLEMGVRVGTQAKALPSRTNQSGASSAQTSRMTSH